MKKILFYLFLLTDLFLFFKQKLPFFHCFRCNIFSFLFLFFWSRHRIHVRQVKISALILRIEYLPIHIQEIIDSIVRFYHRQIQDCCSSLCCCFSAFFASKICFSLSLMMRKMCDLPL